MSARKILLLGSAAVLVLVAIAAAVLFAVERPPAGGPASAAAEPAAAAVAPTVPALAPPTAPADAPPEAPVAQAIRGHPRAAATVAWDDVPQAAKVSELGPVLAAPVHAALQAARAKMTPCFDEDARLAETRPTPVSDTEGPLSGPAILVLRLESRGGALDVVGTEVETHGTSSRELVRCARTVLEGWPIDVAGVKPGTRYRLKYMLL